MKGTHIATASSKGDLYEYTSSEDLPAGSIRLLELLPENGQDELHG